MQALKVGYEKSRQQVKVLAANAAVDKDIIKWYYHFIHNQQQVVLRKGDPTAMSGQTVQRRSYVKIKRSQYQQDTKGYSR